MRKSTIPVVAVLAVAPATISAVNLTNHEAAAQFDAATLKAELYDVINTIGQPGTSGGYVQAVKDKYLVQTSALENAITEYNEKFTGEGREPGGDSGCTREAVLAKKQFFLDKINEIKEGAAAMQKQYQDALDDAQAAVDAATNAAETVINALSVPSVREEYIQKLSEINIPAKPTSAESKDNNEKVKAEAEAAKAAIEALLPEATQANAVALEAQALIFADLLTLQNTVKEAAAAAGTEIATLTENAGLDDTYATNNDGYTAEAADDGAWWTAVKAAKEAHTLDTQKDALEAQGNTIKENIAANLQAAKDAAEAAETTAYEAVMGAIAGLETTIEGVTIADEDVVSKDYLNEASILIEAAKLAAGGYHDEGTSVKYKDKNDENVSKAAAAVDNLQKAVDNYAKYLDVKTVIATVQATYNNDITRLTETLAGNDVYQDTYENANKTLYEIATLITKTTEDNNALYNKGVEATAEEYLALIDNLNGKTAAGTAAVDVALALYTQQEAAKAAADAAVAAAKDGVTNSDVLAAIADVETIIKGKYEAHELTADDYSTLLSNVDEYKLQMSLVSYIPEITADEVAFKTAKAELEAAKATVLAKIGFKDGNVITDSGVIATEVGEISTSIENLNSEAEAELEAYDGYLKGESSVLGTLQKKLNEAESQIKANWTSVYEEFKSKIEALQNRINGLETAVKDAYTDAEEKASSPKYHAVRNLTVDDTIADDIDQLLADAKSLYGNAVDKANEAAYTQLVFDFSDIETKLGDAEDELAEYKTIVTGVEGPDYADEVAALQTRINDQKAVVATAKTEWEAAMAAGTHEPTIVKLLEEVDKVLYGTNYPLTGNKELNDEGIWDDINNALTNAENNYQAYLAEIKAIDSVDEAVTTFLTNLATLTDLTDAEVAAYEAEATRVSQYNNDGVVGATGPEAGGMRAQVKLLFQGKAAAEIKEMVAEYSEDTKNHLNEEDVNDFYSQIELAKNDNKYHQIVNSINEKNDAYVESINKAKTNWATQYSAISGVYADATDYEEYKEDLDAALAGYQKELTQDLKDLNKALNDINTAREEAMADADKCHEDFVSLTAPCNADKDFETNVPTETIAAVAAHIASTTERAEDNLYYFKIQIDLINDLKELVEKGKAEVEAARAQMGTEAADGTTSEALDAAEAVIAQAEEDIAILEASVRAEHIALKAAVEEHRIEVANTKALIENNLVNGRGDGITAFNAEIAAYNEKVLNYEANYLKTIKSVYDKNLMDIEAYGRFKHYQYRAQIEAVQDEFFGLAQELRNIEIALNTAAGEATAANKFFDKGLEYWAQANDVAQRIKAVYNEFLDKTNQIALDYWNTADVQAQLNTAQAAVAQYGYMHNPLAETTPASKVKDAADAFNALVEKANKDIEKKILAQHLDSYLEQLGAINVAADWNDDAKTEFDYQISLLNSIIDEAKGFTYSDGTAYGEAAQQIINDAITVAQGLVTTADGMAAESYAEVILPSDLYEILGILSEIPGNLEDAHAEADAAQDEIYNDAANLAKRNELAALYDELSESYNEAVNTITEEYPAGFAFVEADLKQLGGSDLHTDAYDVTYNASLAGQIEKLVKNFIIRAYARNNWNTEASIRTNIDNLYTRIENILNKAKEEQAKADMNSDYGKVGILLNQAKALIEPYNRAETNKDNTPEDIAEAAAIYEALSGLIAELDGARKAYDEADTEAKKAEAGAALAAILESDCEAKIADLAERITKLDKELTAYNELDARLNSAYAALDALVEEISQLEYAAAIDFTSTAEYTAAANALAAAREALDKSHALNRANADKAATTSLIAAAEAKIEAAKNAALDKNNQLATAAKAEAISNAKTDIAGKVDTAKDNINTWISAIITNCPDVAADYVDDYAGFISSLEAVQTEADAAIAALPVETMTVAELNAALQEIKDKAAEGIQAVYNAENPVWYAAHNAQAEFIANNNAAYNEVMTAIEELNEYIEIDLAEVISGYRDNADILAELAAFAEELNVISDNVDASKVAKTMVQDKAGYLTSIAELKARIEAAAAVWADNNRYGDINSDKLIDIDDVQACINIILDQAPENAKYNLGAADVNGNGTVTVADLVLINNEYMEPGYIADYIRNSANLAPRNTNDVSVATSAGLVQMASETAYSAVQMELTVANNTVISDVNIPGASVKFSKVGENTYRVVALAEADIINSITIRANGNVEVNSVVAADENAAEFELALVATDTTGINSVLNNGGSYTIFGEDGVVRQSLAKGMNIVKDAAGKIKKIFIK